MTLQLHGTNRVALLHVFCKRLQLNTPFKCHRLNLFREMVSWFNELMTAIPGIAAKTITANIDVIYYYYGRYGLGATKKRKLNWMAEASR